MAGGAKGFAEGVLSSPASFVAGLYHLATTRPDTSVRELLQAISSVPQAFREAGVDPEAWGRGVGDLTGQTMVGLSAGPITSRAVSGVRTAAASPLAARVGPKLVKHAATATGAYLGGPAGAIVGSGVGEELAAAMRPKTPPASPPMPTPPSDMWGWVAGYPGYEKPPMPSAPAEPTTTAPATSSATSLRPVPPPEPAQAAPTATPAPFNPTTAMASVRAAFAEANLSPGPGEVSNGMEFVRRGKTPREAVDLVLAKRPTPKTSPMDPAEQFRVRYGLPTPEEVTSEIQQRVGNRSPDRGR